MPPPTLRKETEDPMYPKMATVIDLVKHRGTVNKYYLYVIEVTTLDNTQYFVFRRYSAFNTLQDNLEDKFPIEAGSINMHDRTLPYLPPKKYGGRSSVRSVAEERAPHLISYLRELFELPKKIHHNDLVRAFLRQQAHDDIPYEMPATGSIFTEARQRSLSHDKVASKPKPSVPPARPGAGPGRPVPPPMASVKAVKGPRAQTDYPYTAQADDELSFRKGVTIALLQRIDDSWTQGKLAGKVGLFPSSYVTIIEDLPIDEEDDNFDDEDDEEDQKMVVVCHYRGRQKDVEIEQSLALQPTYRDLYRTVSHALSDYDAIMNYRDRDGDLIMVADDDDVAVMVSEAAQQRQSSAASQSSYVAWQLHLTATGDFSVYHVDPYS
ncbi:neutrophil cytosol factor 4-like [Sycon ciliatum]|uniref:neutrophil cytosol factor 4-like n=1 Tax=Sycon ciliatum TaxID=27933 RepID=UPI0020A89E0E|eukprot:scpid65408/ scgid27689/ Neutrophil cytosol factor 4; Neutrophil NADPH oxidase factor 4; SH3 and PX domain-containing protein 4; p40-phox